MIGSFMIMASQFHDRQTYHQKEKEKHMAKSKVYFSRNTSPDTLVKLYKTLGKELTGKVAVKLHSVNRATRTICVLNM